MNLKLVKDESEDESAATTNGTAPGGDDNYRTKVLK